MHLRFRWKAALGGVGKFCVVSTTKFLVADRRRVKIMVASEGLHILNVGIICTLLSFVLSIRLEALCVNRRLTRGGGGGSDLSPIPRSQ